MSERFFQVNINGIDKSLKDPKISQEYFNLKHNILPKARLIRNS